MAHFLETLDVWSRGASSGLRGHLPEQPGKPSIFFLVLSLLELYGNTRRNPMAVRELRSKAGRPMTMAMMMTTMILIL